ncbi:hypothetical protein [Mucilaginibacter sp. 10I4]|uniref:hypothetical protein n=1 Tax=Mucilaginibacter sp. 10I4 TaxID=3048580 RepID=UPI002B22F780|nr:hypothetical protein [Mucilaginibacter sp. 10I4]MEB0262301.1 hypothetical protein [Mucilaginibacter sp. 10I4]
MAGIPIINGINYSWASISFVLFGVPITQITKISYSRKQKKENNYGAGYDPVSRGYGNREYEASIEMYTDQWLQIIALAPNKDPLQIPPFPIQIIFGNDGEIPSKDVLQSCEFTEDPFTGSQGDTKLMVTIPILPASIDRSA